jgi:hypothetical protein
MPATLTAHVLGALWAIKLNLRGPLYINNTKKLTQV